VSSFVALYQNYADAAVLGGGSYLAALPVTNLKDEDIGKVARSTDSLNASTIVTCDLGSARTVGGVALGPTNISPGKTYRIRAFSDAGYSVNIYDSGTQTVSGSLIDWSNTGNWLAWEDPGFWFGIPNVFDRSLVPIWLVTILNADVVARYWKIEVFDAGNGDGFLQFGRLLIARAFRPSFNYDFAAEMLVQPIFDRVESLGGKRTDWDRGRRRTLRINFTGKLLYSELYGDVFRLSYVNGASRQIFVVPDPGDATNFQQLSFLATLKSPPPIVQAFFDRGTTVIDCEEVL